VICTAGLLCVQHVWASDAKDSRTSSAADAASVSESTTAGSASRVAEKMEKSDKYDVNRIGQRSVGHGINLYSLQKERAMGESMASTIDRGAKFVADPEINEYVRRLGQKIARNSDADLPFTIRVIDSPDTKVFALPGGFLYVDKGLIMAVDSEAELAGLMAHEIAHIAARHATRFATRRYGWSMLTIPLAYLSGPAAIGTRQIGPLTLRKFSRDSEIEADLLGIEYQYAAGYDPQAFVDALEKLHSKEMQMKTRIAKALPISTKVPLRDQFARAFSNYPPTEERIEKVQDAIANFLPGRDDYIIDTSEFQEVKAKLAWADRPILRRHQPGDGPSNGPVLHQGPSHESQVPNLAGSSPFVTKGRMPAVLGYLPDLPY
jgi:Zn-dependent protease with chaperone function